MFDVVGLRKFLVSARPLLERSFGTRIDATLVERYVEHVTAFLGSGMG